MLRLALSKLALLRAVSLVTSFGSCRLIYGSLILCQKAVEKALTILLLVLVYPHNQRGLVRLHRHVSNGRYVQYFGAGVAAHGFQFLEHFSWDSYRFSPAHLPHILRYQDRRCAPSYASPTADQGTLFSSSSPMRL